MLNAADLSNALRRAFNLGQTYWQQADSESLRQHELADKTQAMFDKLLEDTVAACGALERYEPIGRYFMRDGEWVKAAPESPVGETLYRRTAGVAGTPAPLADEAFVGWKLVPVTPTMAMLDAADHKFQTARYSLAGFNARELAYKAMLDAAPPHGVPAHSQSVTVQTLRQHWLSVMECDHATGRDKPHCACSRVDLGWHPSIGAAVEAWLAHVSGVTASDGKGLGEKDADALPHGFRE